MSPASCGIYDDPTRMKRLRALEHWLGTNHTVQPVFTPWNEGAIEELFERILPNIWDAGRVPLLTWEPYTEQEDATERTTRIAAGEYDSYLETWTERVFEWLVGPDEQLETEDDRRLYLRFAHEMNGDWYPWSPSGTPKKYVEMWQHVHECVMREGIQPTHLQWVWCVNHVDVGPQSAEELYPGDKYVDWVGVDGFNWGESRDWSAWCSPRETFEGMFDRLDALTNKPRCVPEFASTTETAGGHDPRKKAAWIRDAYEYFDDAGVGMACWFNEDKETDWAVFGGERGTDSITVEGVRYETYSAYRNALAAVESEEPPARRMSDTAFLGT